MSGHLHTLYDVCIIGIDLEGPAHIMWNLLSKTKSWSNSTRICSLGMTWATGSRPITLRATYVTQHQRLLLPASYSLPPWMAQNNNPKKLSLNSTEFCFNYFVLIFHFDLICNVTKLGEYVCDCLVHCSEEEGICLETALYLFGSLALPSLCLSKKTNNSAMCIDSFVHCIFVCCTFLRHIFFVASILLRCDHGWQLWQCGGKKREKSQKSFCHLRIMASRL